MQPSAPKLAFLFEDDDLIVLSKPAGVPTANAPRGVESIFTLLKRRRPGGAFLGVVSRLDAPVSGVLVFAKNPAAAADLSRQFRSRDVGKFYLAVVEGRFPAPVGTWVDWHDALAPRPELGAGRGAAGLPAKGPARPCHVRARVVRRAGEVSLVELEPSTGRRHQLRLQLSQRGCPIVGDRRYHARLPFAEGIALHARRLEIDHPKTRAPLVFEAPAPAGWTRRFPALFG